MIENDSNNSDAGVVGLLGSLPRVDAPNEFNFKVRARIASQSGSSVRRFSLKPVLGLVVPAALAIGLGAYWINQPTQPLEQAVVSNDAKIAPATLPPIVTTPSAEATDRTRTEQARATTTTPQSRTLPSTSVIANESAAVVPGAGSIDSGIRRARPVPPRGISLEGRPVEGRLNDMQNSASIAAKDILNSIGLDVTVSDVGYTVAAVRSSSVADSRGLRAGDVVEAINDQKVSRGTAFKGSFSGKSIRVIRDGKSVEIDLTKP